MLFDSSLMRLGVDRTRQARSWRTRFPLLALAGASCKTKAAIKPSITEYNYKLKSREMNCQHNFFIMKLVR